MGVIVVIWLMGPLTCQVLEGSGGLRHINISKPCYKQPESSQAILIMDLIAKFR